LEARRAIHIMKIIKYLPKAFFLCFAFLLMAAFFSIAVPVKGEEISLEEALELFYRNNYDILINRYEIDKAYGDFVGARLLPNPNVSFSSIGLDISQGIPQKSDDTQQYLQLDQLILLGGKRELRTNSALAAHQAAILTHKDVIRTLIIGFYSVYYNLQLDRLNIEFGRYDLSRFDKIQEIAQRRFDAGFLSLIDYTKIKLARIDLENNLTNFDKQFRADLESFNFLLGSGNWLEPRKLTMQETFPEYSENILVEVALQNRYDLLSLQKQSEAAKYSISLAKAMKIPDITVGGQYSLYGTDNRSRVGAGVSLPIPVFNRNQGEILRRNAEYKQLEEQIKRVQRLIVSDIRQALNTYRSSLKIFDAYRLRKREMDDLLNRSEAAFSLGGITVLDLLDTRKTYRDFITKYNLALIQALLNQELIKVYTGELR
jgi:cobalt-zinc-cadmium efflux system outer membrane protein